MKNAIAQMLHANILRYDDEGGLNWHGKVQKKEFRQINVNAYFLCKYMDS